MVLEELLVLGFDVHVEAQDLAILEHTNVIHAGSVDGRFAHDPHSDPIADGRCGTVEGLEVEPPQAPEAPFLVGEIEAHDELWLLLEKPSRQCRPCAGNRH
jgi:hypothetical protein